MKTITYWRTACGVCKDYTVHYKVGNDVRCIRHQPNSHDLAEFLYEKVGYKWLKAVRDARALMEAGVSNN